MINLLLFLFDTLLFICFLVGYIFLFLLGILTSYLFYYVVSDDDFINLFDDLIPFDLMDIYIN